MKNTLQITLWSCTFFSLFISALYFSWLLAAQVNFLYPVGYRLLNIEKSILTYAPENHYKQNFSLTTPQEHKRLFNAIAYSIRHQGEGLSSIRYTTKNNEYNDTLLTIAEVTHLQDVANLVDTINYLGYTALAISVLCLTQLKKRHHPLPSLKKYHTFGILGLVIIFAITLLIGAERVFYKAHTWIFPENNQWFFYYQESLMTTIMKAPDLFGFIAIELLLFAFLIYTLLLISIKRLFNT